MLNEKIEGSRDPRLRMWPALCAVLVLASSALVCVLWRLQRPGTDGGDQPVPRTDAGAHQADLSMVLVAAGESELVALVQLANTGSDPLRVDAELVFGVEIVAVEPDGSPIELEHVEVSPVPTPEALAERFVTVRPGESVERQIDLRRGFRCLTFVSGWRPSGGGGAGGEIFQAYEAVYRLPPGTGPDRVLAYYQSAPGLPLYTGTSHESLGLFAGPLTASVDVPEP